jgi:hypothetical protein
MSWKSFQNKNRQHKDNFMKELGEVSYCDFEEGEKDFFKMIHELYTQFLLYLPNKSEKEYAEQLQYALQDQGFETSTHPLYHNCFQIQGEDSWYIVSKSKQPSTLLKLKEQGSIVIIHEKSITQYTFLDTQTKICSF